MVYGKRPMRRVQSLNKVSRGVPIDFKIAAVDALYPQDNPIDGLDEVAKVQLLQRIDKVARATDAKVKEVNVRISANHDVMMVMASDGSMGADVRPLVRLDVSVIVESQGRRERGNSGGGGRRRIKGYCRPNLG